MIVLEHHTVVQSIIDAWMQNLQAARRRPSESDLRDLIKSLEDALDTMAEARDRRVGIRIVELFRTTMHRMRGALFLTTTHPPARFFR
jgi:hypothetical protein